MSENIYNEEFYILEYNNRLNEYKESLSSKQGDKHMLLLDYLNNNINNKVINDYCDHCIQLKTDVDFEFTCLIRLLYLSKQSNHEENVFVQNKIENALTNFPFWPNSLNIQLFDMSNIVFWSENHLIMFLSTAHLYRQWTIQHKDRHLSSTVTDLEEILLKTYLLAHTKYFQGCYECNSHVYLPFSICALLNLIDFSDDIDIKRMANEIINHVMYQIVICTNSSGVCTLSASARSFARCRQRTWGHNINQLVKLLTNHSPDDYGCYYITGFITTTTWRITKQIYDASKLLGFIRIITNHSKEAIKWIYHNSLHDTLLTNQSINIHRDELVPFYWSAGLITDPDFTVDTKAYMKSHKMNHNIHLKNLSWLYPSQVEWLMNKFTHFSKGQSYLDIKLNVYKQLDGLVLSSLEMFNTGICGFQQLPWICNLDGVGVWTQSGEGSNSMAGFGICNTHNPYIKQIGQFMVVSYSKPEALNTAIVGRLFKSKSRLFWPEQFLDQPYRYLSTASPTYSKDTWWIAQRNNCYIGVMCTEKTSIDTSESADAQFQIERDSPKVYLPRRVCDKDRHSWIIIVGTTAIYSSITDFANTCYNVKYQETLKSHGSTNRFFSNQSVYNISVTFNDHISLNIECI